MVWWGTGFSNNCNELTYLKDFYLFCYIHLFLWFPREEWPQQCGTSELEAKSSHLDYSWQGGKCK